MEVLLDSSSTPDAMDLAGEELMLTLYDAVPKHAQTSLLHERGGLVPDSYQMQLASLPPTSAAAREHSWRVYHQVQSWLGNDPLPSDWGWDLVNGELRPVLTRLPKAHDALLNIISCNGKCGCARGCGCRRASCVLRYVDSVVV